MLDKTGTITSEFVKLALDTAVMRQNVLASNIANASSVGYRPFEVTFERQLELFEKVLTTTDDAHQSSIIRGARSLVDSGSLVTLSADDQVRLDKEMGMVAENAVYYQALVTGYGKFLAQLRTAIGGQ